MKRSCKLFSLVILTSLLSASSAYCWLTGWSNRTEIRITSVAALTDYQLRVCLAASNFNYSQCKADGGDIRFVDSDDSTQLNYWLESWTSNGTSTFWIKVPSIPAGSTKTIYIYHGNSGATTTSNGTNTFQFFDDFSTDLLYTNTGAGAGNYSISSGILTMTETTVGTGLDYALKLTNSFSITGDGTQEVKARAKATASRELHVIIFSSGTAGMLDSNSSYKFAGSQTWGLNADIPNAGTDWYTISVILNDFSGSRPISIAEDDDVSSSAAQQFDWIFIKKYSSIEPRVNVGNSTLGTTSISSFTIVVLPDTQDYSNEYRSLNIYQQQTQWIVNNKDNLNIVFVAHMGDITDVTTGSADWLTQWQYASTSMDILNYQVPYLVCPGNHDYASGVSNRTTALTNYNTYFGYDRFSAYPYYGGHYPTTGNENNFGLFNTPDFEFLVIALEFGPTDADITWAEGIINQYPNKKVILFMHAYMFSDETRLSTSDSWDPGEYIWGGNNGDQIWTNLVSNHPNIMLVLSGHILNDGLGRMTSTVSGYNVYQILQNYQVETDPITASNLGYLRYYTVIPQQNKIVATSYNPYIDSYFHDSQNEFELTLTTPTNPTTCTCWNSSSKTTQILSDTWHGVTNTPYFEWSGAADTVGNGASGIKGYSIYVGTNSNYDPGISSTQTAANYTVTSALSSGISYYLRIRTIDNANNWSQPETMFIFKYQLDTSSPTSVNDLTAQYDTTSDKIILNFSNTGDDGSSGALTGQYKIQYLTTNGPWAVGSAQISVSTSNVTAGNGQRYVITNSLTAGNTYYFNVWILDDVGNTSGESNHPTACFLSDGGSPGAITNLTATAGSTAGTAKLFWNATGDDGTTGTIIGQYTIQYLTTDGPWAVGSAQITISTTASSASEQYYTISSGLTVESTYYICIWTTDNANNTSAESNHPSVYLPDVTNPGTITTLTATAGSTPGTVVLIWNATGDDGATGSLTGQYKIQYLTTNGPWTATNAQVTISTSNATVGDVQTYTISSGLTNKSTYYFSVWSVDNDSNNSAESNHPSTYVPDTTAPNAVTTMTASLGTVVDTIKLTWNAAGDDGAIGTLQSGSNFKIQYLTTNGPWAVSDAQITISTSNITPGNGQLYILSSGLTTGTTYYFGIWTTDSANYTSSESNHPYIYLPDVTAPSAITDLTAALGTPAGTVSLTWTAPGDDSSIGNLLTGSSIKYQVSTNLNESWLVSNAQNIIPVVNVSPGSIQTYSISSGLAFDTTYYFCIWAIDETAINISTNSNVTSICIPSTILDTVSPRISSTTAITARIGMIGNKFVISSYTVTDTYNVLGATISLKWKIDASDYPSENLTKISIPPPASASTGIRYTESFEIPRITDDGILQFCLSATDGINIASTTQTVIVSKKSSWPNVSFGTYSVVDGNSSDGATSLNIPVSAIKEIIPELIIEQLDSFNEPTATESVINKYVNLGKPIAVYNIYAQNSDSTPLNKVFDKPVEITLLYLDLDTTDGGLAESTDGYAIPDALENTFKLYRWDGIHWRFIGGTVNTINNTIKVPTTQLGKYAIFRPNNNATDDTAVKPEEKFITSTTPASFGADAQEVKIFGANGSEIVNLKKEDFGGGIISWYGKDKNSKPIESGAFIYRIVSKDNRTTYGTLIIAK